MTIPSSYDLPAKYDQWLSTPPDSKPEEDENFTIEFGDDVATFRKQTYKTLTSAKQEANRLFNRFGFARLLDESGVELERW
jgi:hypothetical protein